MTQKIIRWCAALVIVGSHLLSVQAHVNAYQTAPTYPTLKGSVVKVEVGNDSLGVWIRSNGKTYPFFLYPSTDGLPAPYQQHGPIGAPTITDVGSLVSVVYSEDNYLEYRVLSRPAHLWLTIAASQPLSTGVPSAKNQGLKMSLGQQGCPADILKSNAYRALKPGFWIVAAGGFTSRLQAENCRRIANTLGIQDAYIRQLW